MKSLKLLLSIFLIMTLIFSLSIYASDPVEFPEKNNISLDKHWTITFSRDFDLSEIKSITVKDQSGAMIPIKDYKFVDKTNIIRIYPKSYYNENSSYILQIDLINGKNYSMKFKTESGEMIKIDPRIEFISGILTQTTFFEKYHGTTDGYTQYYKELKEFFDKYSSHSAVIETQKIIDRGNFYYQEPYRYILSLGVLPSLHQELPLPDVSRQQFFGDSKAAELYRTKLAELASESDFIKFYNDHKSIYDKYIKEINEVYEPKKVAEWENAFFGWNQGKSYHILMPGAMVPGGYGVSIDNNVGDKYVYYLQRSNMQLEGDNPFLMDNPDMVGLAAHEWAHPYIQEALDPYSTELNKLENLVNKTTDLEKMRNNGYGWPDGFLGEIFTRAAQVNAEEDLISYDHSIASQNYSVNWGFSLLPYIVQQYKDYDANRNTYKNLKEFIPIIIDRLLENEDKIIDEITNEIAKDKIKYGVDLRNIEGVYIYGSRVFCEDKIGVEFSEFDIEDTASIEYFDEAILDNKFNLIVISAKESYSLFPEKIKNLISETEYSEIKEDEYKTIKYNETNIIIVNKGV